MASQKNIDDQDTIKRSTDIEDSLKEVASYNPGKKERKARKFVWDRYTAMRDDGERKAAEQEWEDADKQFRMYEPERSIDDWRANLVLPDAFAAVQADAQEKIGRRSRPLLRKVEDSDQSKSDFANAILTYNMDRTNFDYQYFMAKYAAGIRGTSFMVDYWRTEEREVDDLTGVDQEGNLTYTKKTITDFDDDFSEWIPNEFVYVDERADHIDKANDGIILETLDIKEFNRKYNLKKGFSNVDLVRPGGDITRSNFFDMPQDFKPNDVLVIHYYNRELDFYYVLANTVMVRIGPMPTKHKELPMTPVYHYRVPGRFWGMGIPKVIKSLSEERQAIRQLNLDRQKMQLNKMFLVDDRIDIDEEEAVARPHGFIEVQTNGLPVNQTIVPLEYSDVPPSYFRTEEILLEDIRRAHGIDDRIQGVNVGGTATEAAILKESAMKRVNMLAEIAEMDTIKRIGRLKWSNIQFFYPAGKIERLFEKNETRQTVKPRRVSVNGKEFAIDENNNLVMSEIDGESVLKLDKKMAKFMEGDFDIMVDAESHQVLSKPIQQAKTTEMVTLLSSNPVLFNELDPTKTVKEYLKNNDFSPRAWMKEGGRTSEDMKQQALMENELMLAGHLLAPTPNATLEHTEEHLNLTQSARYDEAPDTVKQIIDQHIMGEHDANPTTGSIDDALAGAAGEAAGEAAAEPGVQIQPADLQPSTVTGEEGGPNGQGGDAPIAL